jgi:hypothetical protein
MGFRALETILTPKSTYEIHNALYNIKIKMTIIALTLDMD